MSYENEKRIDMLHQDFLAAEKHLLDLLGPQLSQVTSILADEENVLAKRQYLIEMPDSDTVDSTLEELASLVARTSNAYGRLARFSGIARAEFKLAKGRFERKYKQSRTGKNEGERAANAMATCEEEHLAMTVAESVSELAEKLENAARVASESARKIYDKASNMQLAQHREDHGTWKESDFQSFR